MTASMARPDSAALFSLVDDALRRSEGTPAQLLALSRTPSEYRSTYTLEELDAHLSDGRIVGLMFKDLGSAASAHSGPRPTALRDPAREPLVYSHLLEGQNLGTPRCLAATADPAAERHWIVTERVDGLQLCDVGEFETWLEAARWAARLHARFDSPASLGQAHLIVFDADYFGSWQDRLDASDMASRLGRQNLDALSAALDAAVDVLATVPSTFIHGDYFPSNILVRQADGSICPIDWETAALGPGLFDLAALGAGRWDASARARLTEAYCAQLTAEGAACASPDRTRHTLDCCRLLLAVQMVVMPPAWSPPVAHSHDWLGEALSIAASLSRQ